MMKYIAAFASLYMMALTAYAADPNRTPGAELDQSKGIAVMYVTVLADKPGVALVRLSRHHFFGPADSFEIGFGKPTLVVRDMMEETYGWYEMMTTAAGASKVNLRKSLPDFSVKRSCISYVGAVIFDLRNRKTLIAYDQENHDQARALSMLQEQYAGEVSKYGMCN